MKKKILFATVLVFLSLLSGFNFQYNVNLSPNYNNVHFENFDIVDIDSLSTIWMPNNFLLFHNPNPTTANPGTFRSSSITGTFSVNVMFSFYGMHRDISRFSVTLLENIWGLGWVDVGTRTGQPLFGETRQFSAQFNLSGNGGNYRIVIETADNRATRLTNGRIEIR